MAKLHNDVSEMQPKPRFSGNNQIRYDGRSKAAVNNPYQNRPQNRGPAAKTMSSKELENRRARGLCYWCPEKYVIGHKCSQGKQVFLIEVGEEEPEEHTTDPIEGLIDEETVEEEAPQISIHALRGTLHCSTMKMEGMVRNRRLQILIDSGSTHNFLDVDMAERLGCITEDIHTMKVVVAMEMP